MNYNFEKKKLGDISLHISRGITPFYDENGVKVINQKCIRDKKLNLKECRITNPNKRKITPEKFLHKYDVLVNSTGVGTLGRVAQLKEEIDESLTADSHVTIVRPDQKVLDGLFFGYAMINNEDHITFLGEGSTGQTELSRKRLSSEIEINVPDLNIQKEIAKILSDLDAKIDLNQKMNQTLEEIGQAIFKHWFVHFEFPNEEGKPYKSSGGEMVDSELGEIPKGWEVGSLRKLISITSGKRPQEKSEEKTADFKIPLIGASSLMGFVKETLYNKPILVIGRVGTHGVVQKIMPPSHPSDNTLVIKSNYYEFVYQILNRIDYDSLNVGTTQPLITQKSIKNHEIVIPSSKILLKFETITSSLFSKINQNNLENGNLFQIRDSILPKLMSGKIRLPLEGK